MSDDNELIFTNTTTGANGDDERQEDLYFGSKDLEANVGGEGTDNIIEIDNIHKTYLLGVEGVPALRGVSMKVKRGEFVVIFGTSGGGKTTMLNVIGSIDKPTKGRLKICDCEITSRTPDKVFSYMRLKKIGFVFQTFNLLSSLTAIENVEMPMILAGELSAKERRKRAMMLLEKVGVHHRAHHLPSMLSGGEQQRVTIARSVANQPDLLLLDEPTGDLDSVNTCIAMKLISELNKNDGITCIMVTHDVNLKNFAHRVIWMRDGKIFRVEKISDEQRQKRYAELQEELSASENTKNTLTQWQNTFVRKPTDYETHQHYKEAESVQYNFRSTFEVEDTSEITQEDYEMRTGLISEENSDDDKPIAE